MDDNDLTAELRRFWEMYKDSDIEGCKGMFEEHHEDDDFEGLTLIATIAMALGDPESEPILGNLFDTLAKKDGDDVLITQEGLESVASVITDFLDKMVDIDRPIKMPPYYHIDYGATVINGSFFTMFSRNSLRSIVNEHLLDKIKNNRAPAKVNRYISAAVSNIQAFMLMDQLDSISMAHFSLRYNLENVIKRKTMNGETGYASLALSTINRMSDMFRECSAPYMDDRGPPVFKDSVEIGKCMSLYEELGQGLDNGITQERIDELYESARNEMKGAFQRYSDILPQEGFTERILEKKDEGLKEEADDRVISDISAISPDDINRNTDRDKLRAISQVDPNDSVGILAVYKAKLMLMDYEGVFEGFADKAKQRPDSSELFYAMADMIGDDIAFRYLNDGGKPTFAHADAIAGRCPEGPAAFFMRLGRRIMTHLGEAGDASSASDLPDGYAMISRFIFDCYDIEGIDDMFLDIAKNYALTENHIRLHRRKMGKNSDRMINLCAHTKKMYEGMGKYLKKELGGYYVFGLPPIFAGHDFDRAFYSWFMSRDMQGGAAGDRVYRRYLSYMKNVLKVIIYGDGD